ncbi:MAG: Rne/Rng family ribonuclease [Bacteroidetes bacterium]|nr:Rne/Rng family ribonuclease [Bacteroidota bacterium]
MNRELIVNRNDMSIEVALLENKQLVELQHDHLDKEFAVGDIFIGRVKKLISGLNAAFVDIGHPKDAFLHYTDLGPNIRSQLKFVKDTISGVQKEALLTNFVLEPETLKTGKIAEVLKPGQLLLVQIEKEPMSTKGPRLSSEITLAGRNLVVYPFNNIVSISSKIKGSKERTRLQRLSEMIQPKNFGLIIRTMAENMKVAELNEDLKEIIEKWEKAFVKLQEEVSQPNNPNNKTKWKSRRVLSEVGSTTKILRDLLNNSFNNIEVDDKEMYFELSRYIKGIAPEKAKILKYYDSEKPIFDHYNITKTIKSSFSNIVSMPGSAYLVIEKTEALNVIDVNSGAKVDASSNLEDNALKVNLLAVKEISRLLRLRDIGGIIIIDFIDMKRPPNKKQVYSAMVEGMKDDRARHTILPLSRFGLMQITRQRVRPTIDVVADESCPTCNGTGQIGPSLNIIDDLEEEVNKVLHEHKNKPITLYLHPFLTAYLKKGYKSFQRKWFLKAKKWMKVIPNDSFHLTQFEFYEGKRKVSSNESS